MQATLKTLIEERDVTIMHVTAPVEWWELLKRGHCLPLTLPKRTVRKREVVEVVVHPEGGN